MSPLETLPGLRGTFRSSASDPARRLLGVVARLAVAGTVGVAVGALTEWSVPHLPYSLEPLSNSAAPWVLVAFAVALSARSLIESVVLAVVNFVALVMGFYVAEALRGWPVSRHQVIFWSVTSVAMGPLIGLAARWLRRPGRVTGALGTGVLGGLLTGEAVHGLTSLRFSTSAGYWDAQFVLGVGLTLAVTLRRPRALGPARVYALGVSLAACAFVGLGTVAAYQIF